MDEILIEQVRLHEVLYNHRLPEYRDQNIRQAAWEEIGREIQTSGNKAKERWDKLRRCFCNAKNRRRDETKSGMASKKKSLWKYELQMSFITPFLENRKTQSNLEDSQASVTLATEADDLAEESEAATGHSEREQFDSDLQSEMFVQDTSTTDDTLAETVEKSDKAETVPPKKKKQKQQSDTPAHEIVDILKESSALRKRRYEEKSMRQNTESNARNILEPADDTDMFFLSMSRMTKQLPKIEQAKIKLALSNSVLSAEVRCNQAQQPQFISTPHSIGSSYENAMEYPSPAPSSIQQVVSPSDNFSQGGDYSPRENRPSLLQLTSLSPSPYNY